MRGEWERECDGREWEWERRGQGSEVLGRLEFDFEFGWGGT
jgi:hypothetical protein